MAINFLQSQKKQRYLILILALAICVVLFVVWQSFFRGVASVVPASSSMLNQLKIEINFGLIKKDITVVPPHLSVQLSANPSQPALNQKVDLKADINGTIDDTLLTYKFDCNSDGEYEKTMEGVSGTSQVAVGICQYKDYGQYNALVLVSGEFKYFENGQERVERKSSQATTQILVKKFNANPVISSCDVNSAEGSTLVGFQFAFSALASDADGDDLVYLWDFGDGDTADVANPIHQYKTSGNYTPFVTVFDSTDGEKKGGQAICHPLSLILLKELKTFEGILPFQDKVGRKNPFTSY